MSRVNTRAFWPGPYIKGSRVKRFEWVQPAAALATVAKNGWWGGAAPKILLALTLAAGSFSCNSGKAGESAATIAQLLERHARTIAGDAEANVAAGAVYQALCKAAVNEKLAKDLSAAPLALLRVHTSDELGLFIVEQRMEEARAKSMDAAIREARLIETELPGTPVSTSAFDQELDALRSSAADSFLARCGEALGQSDPSLARIALLRRFQYYIDTNETKRAAVDALEFWGRFSESVEKWQVREPMLGAVERAELPLELDVLAHLRDPSAARLLASDLASSCDENLNGKACAPSDASTASSVPQSSVPATDASRMQQSGLLPHARRFRAALDAAGSAKALGDAFTEQLETCANNPNVGDEQSLALAVCEALMYRLYSIESEQGETRWGTGQRPEEAGLSPSEAGHLIDTLQNLHARLLSRLTEARAPRNDQAHAEAIERLSEIGLAVKRPKGVQEAFDAFIKAFPDSPITPKYCLKLAHLYKDQLKTPRKAAEVCRDLIARYPDSPESQEAALYCATLYMSDLEDYEEAYACLSKMLADRNISSNVQMRARYALALCEAMLGNEELAQQHMQELAAEYPQEWVGCDASYWLAQNFVMRQEYEAASQAFKDFTARYPNDRRKSKVQQLINTIERTKSDPQRTAAASEAR